MERVTWGTVRMASGITEEGRNFKWCSLWSSVAQAEMKAEQSPRARGKIRAFCPLPSRGRIQHPLSYLGGTGTKSDSR